MTYFWNKKSLLIFLIAVLIFGLIGYFYSELHRKDLASQIKRWGVSLKIPEFKTTFYLHDKNRYFNRKEFEAVKGTTRVNVIKVDIADHKKYIEDHSFLLNSLYSSSDSPYPETITKVIECPKEFRPKEDKVRNGVIYSLFAGERLNYGICTKDQIAYHSAYGLFDCGKKGVFEIRVYSKEESDAKGIINSFGC